MSNEKVIAQNDREFVVLVDGSFHIRNKKQLICVIPYTVTIGGLLGLLGVLEVDRIDTGRRDWTMLCGSPNTDDGTDLVAANRILFETVGSNVTDAAKWMHLGRLIDRTTIGSPVSLYAVNLTDVTINNSPEVEEKKEQQRFVMLNASTIATSDDSLLLATYLRLLNYFYIQSLK